MQLKQPWFKSLQVGLGRWALQEEPLEQVLGVTGTACPLSPVPARC